MNGCTAMKSIGIMTFSSSLSNYGQILQAFALQSYLRNQGYDAFLIHYDDAWNYFELRRGEPLAHLKYFIKNLPGMRKVLKNKIRKEEDLCRFSSFKSSHLIYGDTVYHQLKDLKKNPPVADVYMTGSDQVWGPTLNGHYDEAYFLSFVTGKPKTAYAASFGRTEFTSATLSEYKKMLSDYTGIAVRENSAVDLLAQMNIPCAGQVLDPTLLLTGEEWGKWIEKDVQGKYVLVYQLHNNPALSDYAVRFARHVGLPLYRVSPTFHQYRRGGKFVYLPGLGEFLSYIKNCTYFITDSFHGTAFALNFNRQFIEILPNNKTGSRNQSILQLTGLQDRIVTDFNDFSIADKYIEYASVNKILEEERKKSVIALGRLLNNL